MAMSLKFRRFHSAVIVLAAFAAGSANAQNISNVTIYYSKLGAQRTGCVIDN